MEHPSRIQFGPFLIDISERVLRRDGLPVPLTPKAFDLLAALLERPGQLISKEELLQKVWPDTFVEESNLAYNVFALRKALGDSAENSRYIETVSKKGYRFTAVARTVVTAVRMSTSPDAENTVLLFHKGQVRSQAAVEPKPELEEAGGTPTKLPFVGQDGTSPVVSRSLGGGRRLVYVRSFVDTNVWRVDTSTAGARAALPPATAIASTRGDTLPNLAPDGRRVVFLSDRLGDFEFWITDLDGSNAVQLTSMGILPGYAKWSPDGALIAFHGDPEGRPDVLVVPSRGGQPRIITKGTSGGAYPSFSRDGRWIYFGSGLDKGEQRIWKTPVSGGVPVQVTKNTGSIAIESYDRDLYYVDAADRPGTIWRLAAAGGAPVKVLEGVVLGNFDVVEGGLYYIDRAAREAGAFFTDRPGGETRLRYFDFATSRSTTVGDNLGAVGFGLTASRDGRTVFFSRVDSSIDELTLVENFR